MAEALVQSWPLRRNPDFSIETATNLAASGRTLMRLRIIDDIHKLCAVQRASFPNCNLPIGQRWEIPLD